MKRPICIALILLILTSCFSLRFSLPGYAEGEVQPSDGIAPEDAPVPVPADEAPDGASGSDGTSASPEAADPTGPTDPAAPAATEPAQPADTTAPSGAGPASPADPTAPAATEPAQSAAPATPPAPVERAVQLQIDDSNIYDGMDRAYKDGYVPQIVDGTVTLVLPLLANGNIQGDRITVTPDLGDPASSPIQYKNYQKTVSLADNPVNVTGAEGEVIQTVPSYLVRFDFPLRADRANGAYPIVLDIRAADENGEQIVQSYNCFVTITDAAPEPADTGSAAPVYSGGGGGGAAPTEPPVSAPRILVTKYEVSPATVMAGEDFAVKVTLKNTSGEGAVQNMLVTVSSESANLVLKNDTSTIFLGDLAAGGTTDLELKYGTDRETPAQRYDIDLAMDFDDEKAVSMTSAGSVTVEVAQPVDVELAPFTMPGEINAGETVQLSFQVMNLGRAEIYNARVELDVPGLFPSGSAFIGNMDPGTSATETLNVFAGMKEGDERYGYTSGAARLIYEDAGGKEYTEEVDTTTSIKELVVATSDPAQEQAEAKKEQAQKIQWWAFIAAGAAAIAALVLILQLRKRERVSHRHVKR